MSVETRKKPTEVPELLTVGFVTLLRSLGLTIPIGSVIAFQESLRELGLENRKSVYWAGRTTLITDPENISLYDQAFIEQDLSPLIQTVTLAIDDGPSLDETANDEERPEGEVINLRYSTSEVLQQKDFALYNLRELEEAHVLMQAMLLIGGSRSSRRKLPSGKKTQYPDLRRTIRRSLRTNGEPIRQDFLERGKRLRRVVFVVDI